MPSLLKGCAWGLLLLGCGGGSSKAPGIEGGVGGAGGLTTDGGTPPGTTDGATMTTRPPAAPLPALPKYMGQIVVTPAAVLLTKMGETAALKAEAFDASGQKMAVTFTWESSRAGQVAVTPEGQVTAMAATGSAQIRVRAGGLVSAPVMVLVAEPATGAVLVSDAQITAGPTAADAMAPTTVGAKVKLSLTGVADLPAGTILLAREGKPVAGKVVSATPAGGGLEVVLETIPLLALFKRLDVEGSYAIDAAAMAEALAMPPKPTMAIGRPGDEVQVIQQPFMLGNKIECEAKLLTGALSGNANVDLRPAMTFSHRFLRNDDTGQWTELMVKLDGSLTVSGSVSLEFSPMLAGTASCSAVLVKIPIPIGGPLAAVLGLKVPLGIGGEIGGTLALAPLKAGLELTGESKVALGFHYLNGVTRDLSEFSNKFELEPTFTLPGGDSPGAALMAHAAFGGTVGLDVAVLFGLGSFSLLEAALMLKAEVKTGPINKGFAFGGAYDLKPTLEAGPGEDAQKALEWLGGVVALRPSVSVTLPAIAQSPRGTLMADKMMAKPEEPVKLTVDLKADSLKFLGLDNVVDVRLYRTPRVGATGLEVVEMQSGSASKTSYTFNWTPTFTDGAEVDFWAGVSSRLAPGVALEVNDKSVLKIRLGMKGKRWKGTVTTACTDDKSEPGSTDTWTETISTTLNLEHETEEDALNAKTKVTGSGMAVEKRTRDYSYQTPLCTIQVHEETNGMATEVQPGLFQTKFHEDSGMYQLLGGGNVVGTKQMTHMESGSCKPPVTTSSPPTKYTAMFGYFINGMVAPGSDSFSGSMTMPSESKGMCTWTWDFSRAQ